MHSTSLMSTRVEAFGLSDIGQIRQNNEDIWAKLDEDGFYVLADGMGGHQAGEIAARETVTNMCRLVRKKITPVIDTLSLDEIKALVRRAIRHVNAGVFQKSRQSPELRGMGTTLCCLLFNGQYLIYAHVGDSRIYRYRNFELTQLTKDHSLLRQMMDQGQISEFDASSFLHKNIITKAIGTEPKVEPAGEATAIEDGDIYLMCTDGLSDLISHDEIKEIISAAPTPAEAVTRLVDAANKKGGLDNITAVIAQIIPKESYDTTASNQLADLSR